MSHYERYPFYESAIVEAQYQFLSVGPSGVFVKAVAFVQLGIGDYYHLTFGDVDFETGKLNDEVRNNNGDRDKILATIVAVIAHFMAGEERGTKVIFGGNAGRMRLYRMVISLNISDFKRQFDISGVVEDGELLPFDAASDFVAFEVIKR